MSTKFKILIISYGAFSGIRDSLVAAMRRSDRCEVVNVEHSLRVLPCRPVYIALIVISAFCTYGTRFRQHLDKTRFAQWVRTRANRAIVRRAGDVDAVISLKVADNPCRSDRPLSGVLTDHTNLLSKRADNYGIRFVESETTERWNEWERQAFESQDFLFPLSRYAARSMVEDYSVDEEKVLAIGAGPNLDVDAGRDAVCKNYRGKNILFVGLDAERKGLPDLLNAFRCLAEHHPDARLDVVGIDGEDGAGIYYHGRLSGEPLKQLFYAAQVFVMPSLREPFGLVFLEAMWAKAVCIGTNRFAMSEFIEDGVTGYLVNPKSPAEIASRLDTLFKDPARLEAMAESAYMRAREQWSWDSSVDRIITAMFGHSITQS